MYLWERLPVVVQTLASKSDFRKRIKVPKMAMYLYNIVTTVNHDHDHHMYSLILSFHPNYIVTVTQDRNHRFPGRTCICKKET